MTAARFTHDPLPHELGREPGLPDEIDVADDVVPVLGVVFQAGPPAYTIAAFGSLVILVVCSPLMILAAVLFISVAVTAILAAAVGAFVIAPLHLARWLHAAHRARMARRVGQLRPVPRTRRAPARAATAPLHLQSTPHRGA